MTPAFSSWQAFFAMGGYGFFVWLAVAATIIPLLALVFHTRWQRKQLLTEIQRRKSREARIKNAQNQQEATL
ncbi:heme exporter protein CcmD [Budvicia aquatica]|uniref:Heme exporter protein D n=1 Tax=Budvicia aquatica TaxID=82979 RepID=A0A2C6DI42_9GAMM|nr:heme exporter protein CcmD [Budvicia aquatica]PHI29958.1 heme exporter protein CcmD [Budvicia aquatica]GKX51693.1 heme exporter protein D [Budvicia aquatica]VFS48780.1 Cytochrome c-type biogenesis protein CcmD [Budvicia aquatica]